MNTRIICTIILILLLLPAEGRQVLTVSIPATNKMNRIENVPPDSIVAVKDIYDEFKKDRKAAVAKYGKKIVSVKGYAVFVGPDVYALPSVELSEKKGGKSRALCVLPFSDYLKLRKVTKGDFVTLTGEVRDLYEKGDQVLLKNCKIEK